MITFGNVDLAGLTSVAEALGITPPTSYQVGLETGTGSVQLRFLGQPGMTLAPARWLDTRLVIAFDQITAGDWERWLSLTQATSSGELIAETLDGGRHVTEATAEGHFAGTPTTLRVGEP